MSDSIDFLLEFSDPESGCSVILDDDGRVAYAYFLNGDRRCVGDVWLYNRCETPLEPEWTERDRAPFANPVEYAASHENFTPVNGATDVTVKWEHGIYGQLIAFIFIREELAAALAEGTKPGWSALAAKDGPIAKTIETRPRTGRR